MLASQIVESHKNGRKMENGPKKKLLNLGTAKELDVGILNWAFHNVINKEAEHEQLQCSTRTVYSATPAVISL